MEDNKYEKTKAFDLINKKDVDFKREIKWRKDYNHYKIYRSNYVNQPDKDLTEDEWNFIKRMSKGD